MKRALRHVGRSLMAAALAVLGAANSFGATLYWDANNNDVNLPTTAGTLTLTENIVVGVNGTSMMMSPDASGYIINNVEGSTTSGKSLTFDATGGSGSYSVGIWSPKGLIIRRERNEHD